MDTAEPSIESASPRLQSPNTPRTPPHHSGHISCDSPVLVDAKDATSTLQHDLENNISRSDSNLSSSHNAKPLQLKRKPNHPHHIPTDDMQDIEGSAGSRASPVEISDNDGDDQPSPLYKRSCAFRSQNSMRNSKPPPIGSSHYAIIAAAKTERDWIQVPRRKWNRMGDEETNVNNEAGVGSGATLSRVPLLQGGMNWEISRSTVEACLRVEKIHGLVVGGEQQPVQVARNISTVAQQCYSRALASWQEKNSFALGYLTMTLSDNVREDAAGICNAHDLWKKLNEHQPKSDIVIRRLLTEYKTASLATSEDVSHFAQRLRVVQHKLALLGLSIPFENTKYASISAITLGWGGKDRLIFEDGVQKAVDQEKRQGDWRKETTRTIARLWSSEFAQPTL